MNNILTQLLVFFLALWTLYLALVLILVYGKGHGTLARDRAHVTLHLAEGHEFADEMDRVRLKIVKS